MTGAYDPAVPLSVARSRFTGATGAARLLGTRPVTLEPPEGAQADAALTLDSTDPAAFTLLGEDGAPITLPVTLTLGDLPRTFYVEAGASATADATLTASMSATDCEPLALELRPVAVPRYTGRTRAEEPGFGFDDEPPAVRHFHRRPVVSPAIEPPSASRIPHASGPAA